MMKIWKEILIQYVLIIGIYVILEYTKGYGDIHNYFYLWFPAIGYS